MGLVVSLANAGRADKDLHGRRVVRLLRCLLNLFYGDVGLVAAAFGYGDNSHIDDISFEITTTWQERSVSTVQHDMGVLTG